MPSMNEFPPWAGCVCANGSIRPIRRLCTAGATRDRCPRGRSEAENAGFARAPFRLAEQRRAPIVRRRDRKERSEDRDLRTAPSSAALAISQRTISKNKPSLMTLSNKSKLTDSYEITDENHCRNVRLFLRVGFARVKS